MISFKDCVTWWFCKSEPHLPQRPPCYPLGPDAMQDGNQLLWWDHVVSEPICAKASSWSWQSYCLNQAASWRSSFVDGLLPRPMKQHFWGWKSQNEKRHVNKWKLNEYVCINLLHSTCAPLKKWCLYGEPAAGFHYGKLRKDPREMDPAAPQAASVSSGSSCTLLAHFSPWKGVRFLNAPVSGWTGLCSPPSLFQVSRGLKHFSVSSP